MSIDINVKDVVYGLIWLFRVVSKNGIFKKDRYYIKEEGIRLECASLAKDLSEINRRICPSKIEHKYTVKGNSLICDLKYEGIVRKNNTSKFLFTFATTDQLSYEEMECYAVVCNKRVRPSLEDTDGLVKKIGVLFSEKLNKNDNFEMSIHIDLGNCITQKKEYILSITKYAQLVGKDYQVSIEFKDTVIPEFINVYELKRGRMDYVKRLDMVNNSFKDKIENPVGISVRAYVFDRG